MENITTKNGTKLLTACYELSTDNGNDFIIYYGGRTANATRKANGTVELSTQPLLLCWEKDKYNITANANATPQNGKRYGYTEKHEYKPRTEEHRGTQTVRNADDIKNNLLFVKQTRERVANKTASATDANTAAAFIRNAVDYYTRQTNPDELRAQAVRIANIADGTENDELRAKYYAQADELQNKADALSGKIAVMLTEAQAMTAYATELINTERNATEKAFDELSALFDL